MCVQPCVAAQCTRENKTRMGDSPKVRFRLTKKESQFQQNLARLRTVALPQFTSFYRSIVPSHESHERRDGKLCTACRHLMAHRKRREIKQQPSPLPDPAVPGCSLVSFHFMWEILCPQAVVTISVRRHKTHHSSTGRLSVTLPRTFSPYWRYPKKPTAM